MFISGTATETVEYKDKSDKFDYIGKYVNGKREDKDATVEWINRNKYKGGWKNDKRHGKGVFSTDLGEKYEGYYLNDMRDTSPDPEEANGPVANLDIKKDSISSVKTK